MARSWALVAWGWNHTLGWVLAWILVTVFRGYQVLISPLTPPSCRFHPSCSSYGVGSVRTHGALKGLALTVWRLVRCNPWNGGGYDPVPPPGRWLPDVRPNDEVQSGTMIARTDADTNV